MCKMLEEYKEGETSEEMVFDLEFEGWQGNQSGKNLLTKMKNIKSWNINEYKKMQRGNKFVIARP